MRHRRQPAHSFARILQKQVKRTASNQPFRPNARQGRASGAFVSPPPRACKRLQALANGRKRAQTSAKVQKGAARYASRSIPRRNCFDFIPSHTRIHFSKNLPRRLAQRTQNLTAAGPEVKSNVLFLLGCRKVMPGHHLAAWRSSSAVISNSIRLLIARFSCSALSKTALASIACNWSIANGSYPLAE